MRIRWYRLSRAVKRCLILLAAFSLGLMAFVSLGKISTTSDHLNALLDWCAVLSYVFFVVLLTLLKPRWLTSLIAIMLILPLLAASAILPLSTIFVNLPHHITPLGDGLVSDRVPIDAVTPGASGADLAIYRRFSWLPHFQRRHQAARYFNTQCDAAAAYAVLQPDHIHVLMSCPPLPGHSPEDARSLVVKLY